MKVKYNERYLQRRFIKWSTIELKMYLQELLEKKHDEYEPGEVLCIQPIREELERRLKEVK